MEEIKKQLAEMCKQKLDYFDIVDEGSEIVQYGLIINFLSDCLADMMKSEGSK